MTHQHFTGGISDTVSGKHFLVLSPPHCEQCLWGLLGQPKASLITESHYSLFQRNLHSLSQPPKHTQAEIKNYCWLPGDKSLFCSWPTLPACPQQGENGKILPLWNNQKGSLPCKLNNVPSFRNFSKVSTLTGHPKQRQRPHAGFFFLRGGPAW